MGYAVARGYLAARGHRGAGVGADLVAPCGLAWQLVRNVTSIPSHCKAAVDAQYAEPPPVEIPVTVADAADPLLMLYRNFSGKIDKHPNVAGQYLNALTFFATLFNKSPLGAAPPLNTGSPAAGDRPLSQAELQTLQRAAGGAVMECGSACGLESHPDAAQKNSVAAHAATIAMYSDAQCPCSAQFVSDIEHVLAQPSFATVDLKVYFEPKCMDAVDSCPRTNPGPAYLKCIHGDEECVGHRYFLCAQHQAAAEANVPFPPSFRQNPRWLQFERCSYGVCQLCDVFTELLCLLPCATYTNFTKPSNGIMRHCAIATGLDYAELEKCAAPGGRADSLQAASAAVCRADAATYGTKGLPVVTVIGEDDNAKPVLVRTSQKIPLVCGPTPLELLETLCAVMSPPPPECATTATMCTVIQNATRLPACRTNGPAV